MWIWMLKTILFGIPIFLIIYLFIQLIIWLIENYFYIPFTIYLLLVLFACGLFLEEIVKYFN